MSYNNTRIRRCEPHRQSGIQFYADEVQERDQKPLGEAPSRFHEFTYKGDNYRFVWPQPYIEEYNMDLILLTSRYLEVIYPGIYPRVQTLGG